VRFGGWPLPTRREGETTLSDSPTESGGHVGVPSRPNGPTDCLAGHVSAAWGRCGSKRANGPRGAPRVRRHGLDTPGRAFHLQKGEPPSLAVPRMDQEMTQSLHVPFPRIARYSLSRIAIITSSCQAPSTRAASRSLPSMTNPHF
jgi:hypothetical protein